MTAKFGTAKGIDMNGGGLTDTHIGHLRFFKVGNNPYAFWYDIHQLRTCAHVLSFFDTDLTQLPGFRCLNNGIV